MMAAVSAAPEPLSVPTLGLEAAFRGALAASLHGLALADRNLLRFHHQHGLAVEQLAHVLCSSPAAVSRQLARVHARVLRELRRRLADRIPAGQVDRILAIAHDRLGHAIACTLA